MGKGGAKLGKPIKGADRKKEEPKQAPKAVKRSASQLAHNLHRLAEYERLAKLANANRERLNKLAAQEELVSRRKWLQVREELRRRLRAEKRDELHHEADILAENHYRDVQRRDRIIAVLSRDLLDQEEQFVVATRTHSSRLDDLMHRHRSHLARLESEFERDLEELKDEFEDERREVMAVHSRETRELREVIEAVDRESRIRKEEARKAQDTEREEIRRRNQEDINMLRIGLENKIEGLERQFRDAHRQYVEHTDSSNTEFKNLVKADKKLNKKIDSQKIKIDRLQKKLASWKKTISQNERECKARNQALRQQRDVIARHCRQLKSRMANLRGSESRRLTDMSILSREARKSNEERLQLAERILKLAELCRKYETEREKVVPFYTDPGDAEQTPEHASALEAVAEEAAAGAAADVAAASQLPGGMHEQDWHRLDRFYERYNKVLLDKLAIEEEHKRLMDERTELQALLQQYLSGISVAEDAVDNANPLLIVNWRVNVAPNQRVRRGRPAGVVEASHVMASYARQGRRT